MRLYTSAGEAKFLCGGGHHSITFKWLPGCAHIDDHEPRHHPLQGCDEGCKDYRLIAGVDPRRAPTIEVSDAELEALRLAQQ